MELKVFLFIKRTTSIIQELERMEPSRSHRFFYSIIFLGRDAKALECPATAPAWQKVRELRTLFHSYQTLRKKSPR